MDARILATGSELIARRPDAHGPALARELEARGFDVPSRLVVADRRDELERQLRAAILAGGLVVTTGGLGPTEDDVTRDALAEVAGVGLLADPRALERIEERARQLGRERASDVARRQALVPVGAAVLANPVGFAPGALLPVGRAVVLMLPGPPSELEPMLAPALDAAVELLVRSGLGAPPSPLRRASLRLAGLGESAAAERLAGLPELESEEARRGIVVAWLAKTGDVTLELASRDEGLLAAALAACRGRLEPHAYSDDGRPLAEVVLARVAERGETIGVAESCTGGLLGGAITAVPGSSATFLGGVTCYSNDVKRGLVGVPAAALAEHGAVSREVAAALAAGARRAVGADWGLGVTGIAGPGGGTDGKPVGLVHFGLAHPDGRVETAWEIFPGTRDDVRQRSALHALWLLYRALG